MNLEMDRLRRRVAELEAALNAAIRVGRGSALGENLAAKDEAWKPSDQVRADSGRGLDQIDALVAQDDRGLCRLITESVQDAFWISTPGLGSILYVSSAYETLWERSRKELYESPRAFLDALHPDDLAAYLNTINERHARRRASRQRPGSDRRRQTAA